MIDTVIRSPKGMVLVLDEQGERMPEFQGKYEQVRVKILARAPKSARFFHGPLSPVLRKDW